MADISTMKKKQKMQKLEPGASIPLKPWSKCSIEKVGGMFFPIVRQKLGEEKFFLLV
jgi:hypothetical protein